MSTNRKMTVTKDTNLTRKPNNIVEVKGSANRVSIQTITPEMAADMLSRNTHNFRKLSDSRAKAMAEVMARGQFKFNGVSVISIREDETVRDGQTRLRACQLAGVPFTSIVYRGSVEAEEDIDTGSKRSTGQVLQFHGVVNANSTAAAVKAAIALFEKGNVSHLTYTAPLASIEVKQWLDKHPQMAESVRRAADCPIGMFQALVAAIHYQGMSIDSEHTEWWINALCTGEGLGEQDPVFRLRARFNIGGKRIILKRTEQAALLIKSWNLSRWGKVVKSLTWRGSGAHPEPFPVLGMADPGDTDPGPEGAQKT